MHNSSNSYDFKSVSSYVHCTLWSSENQTIEKKHRIARHVKHNWNTILDNASVRLGYQTTAEFYVNSEPDDYLGEDIEVWYEQILGITVQNDDGSGERDVLTVLDEINRCVCDYLKYKVSNEFVLCFADSGSALNFAYISHERQHNFWMQGAAPLPFQYESKLELLCLPDHLFVFTMSSYRNAVDESDAAFEADQACAWFTVFYGFQARFEEAKYPSKFEKEMEAYFAEKGRVEEGKDFENWAEAAANEQDSFETQWASHKFKRQHIREAKNRGRAHHEKRPHAKK